MHSLENGSIDNIEFGYISLYSMSKYISKMCHFIFPDYRINTLMYL